jgi:ATP-dependent Lhr-like helicase
MVKKRVTIKPATEWLQSQGWQAFPFQRQAWKAYLDGYDLMIHSATGTGKTLAAWMGPILESLHQGPSSHQTTALWITPLRALASDTVQALQTVMEGMKLPWTLQSRTGDTSGAVKKKQRTQLPHVLVTTPESATILQSYPESHSQWSSLRVIIVDEWHELIGTKRGVLLELALSRFRSLSPGVRTIGLSATLGNLNHAFDVLVGPSSTRPKKIIHGIAKKKIVIRCAIPEAMERFPWAGHLGTRMAPAVCHVLDQSKTSLIFTNTRNQTELWYQELLKIRNDYAGQIALHHGSLDLEVRAWVEQSLRDEKLKGVVCTSSLDLGVDFASVEEVVQIGSPKGIARLLQRAGRSGHQPNAASRMLFVPANALELIELAAARRMMKRGILEHRESEKLPLDLLSQHLVTRGLAGPYRRSEILRELRSTHAYQELTEDQLEWVIRFAKYGGDTLSQYEDFRRLEEDEYSNLLVTDPKTVKRHRVSIGTIVAEMAVPVRFLSGRTLGNVEEAFIAKLKQGDRFLFAGKLLELVNFHNSIAWVRKSKGTANAVPRWMGGRMPLSSQLSQGMRELIEEAGRNEFEGKEMQAVRPILSLQRQWSHLPARDELLIEKTRTREGYHLFIYPFDGRLVHEGLAAIIAYRLTRRRQATFSLAASDYGFLLHSMKDPMLSEEQVGDCFRCEGLADDITAGLNSTEMAKRQFREIARIAGLIRMGYPGEQRSSRHLQASSDLIYDVFSQYDPGNLLLLQAKQEVLNKQFEWQRLQDSMKRLASSKIIWREPQRPTPLGFALLVDRLRERVSSETLAQRVRNMQQRLEAAAETS